MPTDIAKYSIELFNRGGEGAGIEEILDLHADLKVARSIFGARVEQYPGRLRGASSRPSGNDLALRGLPLAASRNDDASVPSFTVKP